MQVALDNYIQHLTSAFHTTCLNTMKYESPCPRKAKLETSLTHRKLSRPQLIVQLRIRNLILKNMQTLDLSQYRTKEIH